MVLFEPDRREDLSYLFPKPLQDAVLAPWGEVIYVDVSGDDSTGNGSPALPYATIQKGVDEAGLAGGGTVLVGPGDYDETVYIRVDNVYLLGYGQKEYGTARIAPSSGSGVVISNATMASLATWFSGGASNYETNYGSLVADATTPRRVVLQNLRIETPNAPDDYAVIVAGVGNATQFLSDDLVLSSVYVSGAEGSLYARLANYIRIRDESRLPDFCLIHNLACVWLDYSLLGDGSRWFYLTTEDEPFDTSNLGLNGAYSDLVGVASFYNEATAGQDINKGLVGCRFEDVDLEDTTVMAMGWGAISNTLTVATDAQFDALGVHIGGNLTFATGGGDIACRLQGGGRLGSVTDPGGRFTYTPYKGLNVGLSSISLASNETCDGVTSIVQVGQFIFDPNEYGPDCRFQFETILSVNNVALTGTVSLYNLTDHEAVTGTSLATSNTSPTQYNSGDLTVGAAAGNLKNSQKMYEVRLENDGAAGTDLTFLGSARILIFG